MTEDEGRHSEGAHAHGRMLRPEAAVLPDAAVVPEQHLVRPPPNRFTHELTVDEPYSFDLEGGAAERAGVLRAGTNVVVLVDGPERARVVDGSGLYVEVRRGSLRELA